MPDIRVEAGIPINLAASQLVKAGGGVVLGVFCASATAGTLKLWDSLTASGNVIAGTFTLAPGQFTWIPSKYNVGLFATIGGTADITVFYE